MHEDSDTKKDTLASPLTCRVSGPLAGRAHHPLFLLGRVACMAGAKCQRRKGCCPELGLPAGRRVAGIPEPFPVAGRLCPSGLQLRRSLCWFAQGKNRWRASQSATTRSN
jgi:hypothetical protein